MQNARTVLGVLRYIDHWRAGCRETGTSGSAGGRKEKDPQTAGTSPYGLPNLSRRKLNRYAATVDTTAAFEAQGKAVPADAPKTITYETWLDSSGLVRKLSFTVAYVTTELTLDDFNKTVSIEAPSASDIVTS